MNESDVSKRFLEIQLLSCIEYYISILNSHHPHLREFNWDGILVPIFFLVTAQCFLRPEVWWTRRTNYGHGVALSPRPYRRSRRQEKIRV